MLQGKVILVTGASSGIGKAATAAFARAGAKLVLVARRPGDEAVSLARDAGADCIFVTADVSKEADVEGCVRAAIERFGRLDGAFNNAASADGAGAPLADFSPEDFDRTIAGTLRSVWLCMRAEVRAMLAQDPPGGAIVNTSSINGLGSAPLGALYSAAKAGVIALSKGGALDYAAKRIRVNALIPGAFRTPMLEGVMSQMAGGSAEVVKAIEEQYEARIPLGRIGDPAEAAQAAAWLLSDAASYVTGASLIVDGGMTSLFR